MSREKAAWIPKWPGFWLGAFVSWCVLLFTLSSFTVPAPDGPEIPHLDKIIHFLFFGGGCGLLCIYLFRRKPEKVNWPRLMLIAVLTISCIGLLDEWHQSFTPGRSGNDPLDWAADTFGAIVAAVVFKMIHRWFQ